MKNQLKIITLLSIIFCLFFVFNICLAEEKPLLDSGSYSSGCINSGSCTLNDFVMIAVRVSQIILGITGSLALLFFIYGGVMFLISGGSSERVTQAKNIIIGAAVGLVIVFTSFMIIQFVFTALGIPGAEGGKWAISGWFKGSNTNNDPYNYGTR
jgi:hypothetical protein